jgi:nucleoside-diphosphate-sugar epimerase
MKVVITGGSGFIGGEIVSTLQARGAEVLNLDCNPPPLQQARHWQSCDVRSIESVNSAILNFDPNYVLHLASDIDVNLPTLESYATTIEGTRNVIAACAGLHNLRRFIHVSTQYVMTPGVQPHSETEFQPYTLYGEAKAQSELTIRQSALADWIIVRPTIIWGPRHPSFANAIWKYLANRKYLHPVARKPILRCYGFVRNTAEQMTALLDADLSKVSGRVFYLGDGTIDHDRWIDGFACAFTGKRARRVPKSALLALGLAGEGLNKLGVRFPMDMGRYFRMTTSSEIDLNGTFAIVGSPKISLEQGISETVAWLSQLDPILFKGSNINPADEVIRYSNPVG